MNNLDNDRLLKQILRQILSCLIRSEIIKVSNLLLLYILCFDNCEMISSFLARDACVIYSTSDRLECLLHCFTRKYAEVHYMKVVLT